MPPKFKRHLNDDEVTGSIRSERRNLLEEDSDEEEDFFLRGPTAPRFGPQNDKFKQVQSQVDEVIDVMQENISKVIERGERLEDLQDKSESLSDNASAFSSRAKHLHRRMWWRDMKVGCLFYMKLIIALVVVALLLIIIIPVILRYRYPPLQLGGANHPPQCQPVHPQGSDLNLPLIPILSLEDGWSNQREKSFKK
ncbi:hypothetical protein F7725_027619, partial [Dissostichus mawsoni]